jgi:hypothetical protein
MTWEVLRDTGIHTYHMEDNPEYAYIIFTRYIHRYDIICTLLYSIYIRMIAAEYRIVL